MKKISFCTNTTSSELEHIKLLLKSLQVNLSTLDHEIVVFIDTNDHQVYDWVLTQKTVFPDLKILRNPLPVPYGYQRNMNELFKHAKHDIVSYLQSDMVVCKNYDLEVLKHLDQNMILCSTRIEPPLHGNAGEKITLDFGLDPKKFDLSNFTTIAENYKQDKITNYFFAPFTLYKSVWLSIGGHDTLFRRSREDSDVLARLVLNNVNIIQVWDALVYHFTCTSSRGADWFNPHNVEAQSRVQLQQIADNIEVGRFLRKWGKFQHELTKLRKYNISAVIHGKITDVRMLTALDIYFNKICIEDDAMLSKLQEVYDARHVTANKLFNVAEDDWRTYSYMINKYDARDIYTTNISDIDDDVVIKFDISHLQEDSLAFLRQLQDVIDETSDIGVYEYGIFVITINRKVDRASELIVVTNPTIKPEHLYTIH